MASLFSSDTISPLQSLQHPGKYLHQLQPISFDKVFQFDKFNSLCKGFVQLGRYSDLQNGSDTLVV
ncbi:hypothetical protein Hanom_Chr14g01328451 [Helianthus anomalus]